MKKKHINIYAYYFLLNVSIDPTPNKETPDVKSAFIRLKTSLVFVTFEHIHTIMNIAEIINVKIIIIKPSNLLLDLFPLISSKYECAI